MSVLATYRQLLRNGPLTRLLVGEFVSSIGDWLYLVALVVLVYRETGDPVILGIVGAARLVPYLVLSIPAGIITDRFDRRMVLLVSDLARAACMVVMAVLLAAGAGIWPIAIVAIVAACFSTFFYPAIGALLPSLVHDETEFGPANSAWATLDNAAWVVGPGIAGVILAAGSIEFAFLLNAASFALIAVVLWTLPRSSGTAKPPAGGTGEGTTAAAAAVPPVAPKGSLGAPDAQRPARPEPERRVLGLRFPASIDLRAVAGVVVLDTVSWFAFGGISILIVLLAIDVFHGGEEATGYLNAAIGVGGVVGAVLSGVLVLRPRLGPALLIAGAAFSASIVLLGIAPALAVAFAGVVVLDTVSWFAFGGISILIVLLAIDVFHGGEEATGYLSAAIGVGGVGGAVLSGVLVLRPRLGPALLIAGAAFSASIVLLGIAPALAVAFAAIAVASVGNLVLDVTRTTIFQRVIPDAYRGRFTGVLVTSQAGSEALGTLFVPILAGILGVATVLGVIGVAVFGATLLAVALIGRSGDVAAGPYDADLRRIARLPLFGGLSPARIEAALRKLEPIRVEAGAVVVRQGDPADRFFVIGSGTFEVTQHEQPGEPAVRLRALGRDDVFGERGLLARTPRTATVTAIEPGLLFAMDAADFLSLVGGRRGIAERFLALYDAPGDGGAEAQRRA